MRWFSGLSFPLFGRARAGIASSGRPWAGVRAGDGPAYAGASITSTTERSRNNEVRRASVTFEVDDEGRVFVGRTELDLAALKQVVATAEEIRGKRGAA